MKMIAPPNRRGLSSLRLIAVLLLLSGASVSYFSARRPPGTAAPSKKKIEDIQLGDRVAGKNPIRSQVETAEPDPATWRKLCLHLPRTDGKPLEIELLRPLAWIEAVEAAVGQTIFLDLAEMGAVGEAKVLSIEACPSIKPGKGTVVTGKFVHQSDGTNVVELKLEGEEKPSGVTRSHPYWSVDRQEFVPAGELRARERVDTRDGVRQVESTTAIDYRGKLYNLETAEHVFRVGAAGALVHNSCPAKTPFDRRAVTQGFQDHHIISDKNALTANHELLDLAGFDLQSRANKLFLPTDAALHPTRSIHLGRHRTSVSRNLAEQMDQIVEIGRQQSWSQEQYLGALRSMISEERQLLKAGDRALNKNMRP